MGVAKAAKVAEIITTGRDGPATQRLPWPPTWPASSCHVPPFLRKPTPTLPPPAYITRAKVLAGAVTAHTAHGELSCRGRSTEVKVALRVPGNGVVEERRLGRRGVPRRGRGGLRRRGGCVEQVRRRGAAQLGQ